MLHYTTGDQVRTVRRVKYSINDESFHGILEGVIIAVTNEGYRCRMNDGSVITVHKSGHNVKSNGDLKKTKSFNFYKKIKNS